MRDDPAAAASVYGVLLERNGIADMGTVPVLVGSPDEIADRLRPYVELGFATIIVRMPAPYDRETIDRMVQVQERIGA